MTELSTIIAEIKTTIDEWVTFDTIDSNPEVSPYYIEEDEDEYWVRFFTDEFHAEELANFIEDINSLLRRVRWRIKKGKIDDHKYHDDMAYLYNLLFVENQWVLESYRLTRPPSRLLKSRIIQYEKQIVEPYQMNHLLMMRDAIYVLKHETPISEDNICDIMSYLTDEVVISKHQVDKIIYEHTADQINVMEFEFEK